MLNFFRLLGKGLNKIIGFFEEGIEMKKILVLFAVSLLLGFSIEKSFGASLDERIEGGDKFGKSLGGQFYTKGINSNNTGKYSKKLGKYEIQSGQPIKVLPPSFRGTIVFDGKETVVRQNPSGGIQAVGADVSITKP